MTRSVQDNRESSLSRLEQLEPTADFSSQDVDCHSRYDLARKKKEPSRIGKNLHEYITEQ